MEDSPTICFNRLCDLYAAGEGLLAVSEVLRTPDTSLDLFSEWEDQYVLDYVDALCFGDLSNLLFANARVTCAALKEALQLDAALLTLLATAPKDRPPRWFLDGWLASVAAHIDGDEVQTPEQVAKKSPGPIRRRLQEHLELRARWIEFLDRRRDLGNHLDPGLICYVPCPAKTHLADPARFTDQFSLQHALFQRDLFEELVDKQIHVLDRYPHHLDNPEETYARAREEAFAHRMRRLGQRRRIAAYIDSTHRRWQCPHKSRPAEVEPFAIDARPPARRPLSSRSALRLAHVTAQMIDANHAPSRVVRTLFSHHDQTLFAPSLLVTEVFVPRRDEYPLGICVSQGSAVRGAKTLAALEEGGIEVWVESDFDRYEATAQRIAEQLKAFDVALFHGPNPVHLLAATLCDAPLKVFYEHSELPPAGIFDLVIASDPKARDHMECAVIPFVVDQRARWLADPYPSNAWGVSEDAQILTTISLSLGSRLSEEMLEAVRQILEAVRSAYYCPLGPISEAEEHRVRGRLGSVSERVHFLGEKANTAQWVRSATLYLNEFPFGGCIAVLEALAAGVPVMTLCDPSGPPQGRYGAQFFGMRFAARSPEEYVSRACELLTDSALHRSWSEQAKRSYQERGRPEDYVRRVEKNILEALR